MKKLIYGILFLMLFAYLPICVAGTAVDRAFNDNIRRGDGKIVISSTNEGLDISKGVVDDQSRVNVFGLAPAGVQTTATDIWDRADATPTQPIYIKPTAARVHQLVSASTDDDGDPAGIGARTVRVHYLKDWDTPELSVDVVMNGTTDVALPSLVFINKMEVLTMGTLANNVGAITATADTDSTISAVMLASQGVTKNAIYGLSSLDTLYIKDWYGSVNDASGASAHLSLSLLTNLIPDSGGTNTAYLRINKRGLQSTGTSSDTWSFDPPVEIKGPAIVKIQGTSSANDIEGSAGINGILKVNTSGFTVLITQNRRILTGQNGAILRTQ